MKMNPNRQLTSWSFPSTLLGHNKGWMMLFVLILFFFGGIPKGLAEDTESVSVLNRNLLSAPNDHGSSSFKGEGNGDFSRTTEIFPSRRLIKRYTNWTDTFSGCLPNEVVSNGKCYPRFFIKSSEETITRA